MPNSPAEAFLIEFHNTRPGLTSKAFSELPVLGGQQTYPSSYARLEATIPYSSGCLKALDLACGDGYLLALLAKRNQPGLSLHGIDLSRSELMMARDRLGFSVMLNQARAQYLPYATASLDYVLSHMALMLMEDIEQVLLEVRRVLKPGAILAAVVGAATPPSPAVSAYIDILSGYLRQDRWSSVRFGDKRIKSRDGITELLKPAFKDVIIEELHTSQRLSPRQLWEWLEAMYDLYLFEENEREKIKAHYRSAMAPLCGTDNRIEMPGLLHYVTAVAR